MKPSIWTLLLVLIFALAACDDDEQADGVTLSLSSRAVVAAARAEGDVNVTRARMILEEVELETDDDDDSSSRSDDDVDDPDDSDDGTEFEAGPILLELALDGSVNEVLVSNVPAGLYDEIEFEIDELDDDEPKDAAAMSDPDFGDFMTGGKRYSVIIEGTVEDGGVEEDFTFRSDLSAEQEYDLVPPMVLEGDDNDANLTLVIDTTMWFDDGSGGTLDPRDPADAEKIEDNIIRSIEVFEDDDEDGEDDDD